MVRFQSMSMRMFHLRWWIPLAPAVAALVIRLWFAFHFADSPLWPPLEGGHDRTLYHQAAQGPFWPAGAFEYLPLYPMALRLVYALFGPNLWAAAGFGIACDTLTTFSIMLIARRLGARNSFAILAALLYAFYPLAIVYSCITMPNTLNALLAAAIVYGILRVPRDRPAAWAGLGLLAGFAALGWAAWLMIAIALLAYWLVFRPSNGPTLPATLVFTLAFLLPLIPIARHNTRAEGSFVLLTTHGGFNFYMGNHERATGYPVRVQDFRMSARAMLEDAHRAAERAEGHTLSRAESSAWWSTRARAFWQAHPNDALKLTAYKLLLFWNRTDVDDLRMVEQSRLITGWFAAHAWPGFFFFGCLGLIGLLRTPNAGAPRIVILAGMTSLALYFITARYRLTLAPLLAAVGAGSIEAIGRDIRARKRLLIDIAIILATTACVAWPIAVRDVRATDYHNAALQLLQVNRIQDSINMARAGLELDPRSADLYHVLGSGLFKQMDYAAAATAFARCTELDPAHPQAVYNWGLSLVRSGDYCGGLEVLTRAATIRPLPENAYRLSVELAKICAGKQ